MLATACAEDIAPSIPQSNPQEPIFAAGNVESVKAGVLASDAVLDLESYKVSNEIPVIKLEKADSLPAGATVSFKVEISDTQDFKRSETFGTTAGTPAEDGTVIYYASATDWNDAQVALMGKSPKVKTMYYRVPCYINVDGSDYRLNGVDYYAVAGTIQETCFDMGFVIEDHYYLLSDATTWSLADAAAVAPFAFTHSEYDVYDDPVFEIRFKVTGNASYWKIAPQSAVGTDNWTDLYGPETINDTSLEGRLLTGADFAGTDQTEPNSGLLTEPGNYKMTINMEAMTYEIKYLAQPDILYTPGGANGWTFDQCAYMQLYTDAENPSNNHYYGVFPVDDQGFKITVENDWDIDKSTNYGAESETPADAGTFVAGDAGKNIHPLTAGLNWINCQYDPVGYQLTTYEITAITTVGVIGNFPASNSWSNAVMMTSEDGGNTWTAEIEFAAGSEYKFIFNSNWDYSLGGNENQLVFNGGNLKIAEAGTYTVTLNLGKGYPSCTLTQK